MVVLMLIVVLLVMGVIPESIDATVAFLVGLAIIVWVVVVGAVMLRRALYG